MAMYFLPPLSSRYKKTRSRRVISKTKVTGFDPFESGEVVPELQYLEWQYIAQLTPS